MQLRTLSGIAILGLGLTLGPMTSAADPTPGQIIVSIDEAPAVSVNSVTLRLSFDPAIIEPVLLDPTDPIQGLAVHGEELANAAGAVVIASSPVMGAVRLAAITIPGFGGPGDLASVEVQLHQNPIDPNSVSVLVEEMTDLDARAIPPAEQPAIGVRVPEPGSLALGFLCVALLWMQRAGRPT